MDCNFKNEIPDELLEKITGGASNMSDDELMNEVLRFLYPDGLPLSDDVQLIGEMPRLRPVPSEEQNEDMKALHEKLKKAFEEQQRLQQ